MCYNSGMPVVYIGLGTNLGNREENLREAKKRLSEQVKLITLSQIYETEPWGVLAQPRFLNQVVQGETELEPFDLLHFCKAIEREMGRAPSERYGPRLIDLDILFYDALAIQFPELAIPHARLHERRFILVPLAELAPDLVHPVTGRTIMDLLADLPEDGSVKPYRGE